jgi:hypothetical protein
MELTVFRIIFTGRLAFSLVDSFVNRPNVGEATEQHPLPGTPLTAREVEVLQMLASGKMKFHSFSELMRFAIRSHLVDA